MTDMLSDEEKRAERLCMNFCYEQEVFLALSSIGQAGSTGVIRETIALFALFVENEDENFLGNERFAQSLIVFLEASHKRSQPAFEGEFVELLFSISAKIRLSPGILEVWFTRVGDEGEEDFRSLEPRQRFAGVTNKVCAGVAAGERCADEGIGGIPVVLFAHRLCPPRRPDRGLCKDRVAVYHRSYFELGGPGTVDCSK